MRIALQHISADGLCLDGELPVDVLQELAESLKSNRAPVSGSHKLRLTRHDRRVRAVGAVDLTGELPCSACLTPATWQHRVALDVALVPQSDAPEPLEGGELTGEAVEQYTYERDELDLTRMLHDEIVMELPLRHVCRANCLGLCPACGKNQNELGRLCACQADVPTGPFAALKTFRPKAADSKA